MADGGLCCGKLGTIRNGEFLPGSLAATPTTPAPMSETSSASCSKLEKELTNNQKRRQKKNHRKYGLRSDTPPPESSGEVSSIALTDRTKETLFLMRLMVRIQRGPPRRMRINRLPPLKLQPLVQPRYRRCSMQQCPRCITSR